MKKFILLFTIIISFTISSVIADELPIREKFEQSKPTFSNKCSVVKFFQEHANYANQKDINNFISFYAPEYTTNDGFDITVTKEMVRNLWKEKANITFKNTINTICFYGDTAIVNVTETATAKLTDNSTSQKGTLKSSSNVVYSIKRAGKSWLITSANVITEEINMLWGDAKYVAMYMEAPAEVAANSEYSAKLFIAPPTGILAVGSINTEKITYPQQPQKNSFRKFSPDYTLERLLVANSDNTNEYAISTIMFTHSNSRADNLTGFAYLIRRVNVVPQNKFIEVPKKSDEKNKK